jgi:hypothetical protein
MASVFKQKYTKKDSKTGERVTRDSKKWLTERGEHAGKARDDEGEDERRSCEIGGGGAGDDENSRADDAADAERNEVDRAERSFEFALIEFVLDVRDRFLREQLTLRHL